MKILLIIADLVCDTMNSIRHFQAQTEQQAVSLYVSYPPPLDIGERTKAVTHLEGIVCDL